MNLGFNAVKRQLLRRKGDIWLLSAKWATPFLGLVGSIVSARFLAPEDFGVVQAVLLIPTYASFMHFGVFNGLNRNLPLYKARGDLEQTQRFVDASARAARWVGWGGCVVALVAILLFFYRANNPLYSYVGLALMPAMAMAPLTLHLETVYRGTRNFERLGKCIHLQNIWTLLCSVSTSVLGVTGMVLKIATQNLPNWFFLRRRPPMPSSDTASLRDIRNLSVVGLPMLVSGILYTWLAVADRTVIATFLTAQDLGHFALATLCMTALQVFPASISQLLYPRVAHAYGAGGSPSCLRSYVWIGLALNFGMMAPMILGAWFALPFVVETFLPAYSPGIPAARIALIGSISFCYMGPSVIIPVLRRNLPVQIAAMVAIALVWLGGFLSISSGRGIIGVALARAVATSFYAIYVVAFVLYLTRSEISRKVERLNANKLIC